MRLKNHGGFTLVEGIVVAVIVAVLAAIAIPVYTGFLRDAREEAVLGLAETAAAAADVFFRKTNSVPSVADLNLHYSEKKFDVSVDGNSVVVSMDEHPEVTAKVPYR